MTMLFVKSDELTNRWKCLWKGIQAIQTFLSHVPVEEVTSRP